MFYLIVAHNISGGIGNKGNIPWKSPEDMEHFRKTTDGNVVIMGRKTWDSIPSSRRPLRNRFNIIISKDEKMKRYETKLNINPIKESTIKVVDGFDDLFTTLEKHNFTSDVKKFIIGGESIYNEFARRDLIEEMYISVVKDKSVCDRVFNIGDSIIKKSNWKFIKYIDNPKLKVHKFVFINNEEMQIINTIRDIIKVGVERNDRTGVGNYSIFSRQMRFSLENNSFPLLTTRKMPLKMIFSELMWMIRGQTDVKFLHKDNNHVWDNDTKKEKINSRGLEYDEGDIGPAYGFQMRHAGAKYRGAGENYKNKGIDQLYNLINAIKESSEKKICNRRMIINLWNTKDINKMTLPPCAFCYQFYLEDKNLSCNLMQRSSDIGLAGGWNIAFGSLLTILVANVCKVYPKEFIWTANDIHIYKNQLDSSKDQIERLPRRFPKLFIKDDCREKKIENFEFEDIKLVNYNPMNKIKYKLNT